MLERVMGEVSTMRMLHKRDINFIAPLTNFLVFHFDFGWAFMCYNKKIAQGDKMYFYTKHFLFLLT